MWFNEETSVHVMTLQGHRFVAMLAENFKGQDLRSYFASEHIALEQKFDGHRLLLHIKHGELTVYQRHGKVSQHNQRLHSSSWLSNFLYFQGREVVFDGELVDNQLHVFDIPHLEGYVTSSDPFHHRRTVLEKLFSVAHFNDHLQLVMSVRTPDEKIELFRRCLDQNAEGLILKDVRSSYISGRSSSILKLKFTRTADLEVVSIRSDDKESAEVATACGQIVGKVSLLGKEQVSLGDIIEVEYLYVGTSGRLVQPRMKFIRQDKTSADRIGSLAKTDKKAVVTLE